MLQIKTLIIWLNIYMKDILIKNVAIYGHIFMSIYCYIKIMFNTNYSSSLICSTVLSSSKFGFDSTSTVVSKVDFSSSWLFSFCSSFSITSTSFAGSSCISSCFAPHLGQNLTFFSISAKQLGHCLLSFNSKHCFKFDSISSLKKSIFVHFYSISLVISYSPSLVWFW